MNVIVTLAIGIIATAVGVAILHIYTPWLDNIKRHFPRRPGKVIEFSGEGADIINFHGKKQLTDDSVLWGYEAVNGKLSRFSKKVTFDADLTMSRNRRNSATTKGKITGSGPLYGDTAHITYSIKTDSGYWSGFMILEIKPAAEDMSGYWLVSSPVEPGRVAFGNVVLERKAKSP